MYDNNKACKRCVEEGGTGEYSECVYLNKDCHDYIIKTTKTTKLDTPMYYFEEEKGKEVCRNYCLIEKMTLKDGRNILIALLSERVDLEKDPALKEFFDNLR